MKKLISLLLFACSACMASPPVHLPVVFNHVHLMDEQFFSGVTLQFQNAGIPIATFGGGLVAINCIGSCFSLSGNVISFSASGGGLSGQTVGGVPIAATATTSTSSAAPSGYAGVAQSLVCITGSSCTVAPEGITVRTDATATPAIVGTDRLNAVIFTNASPAATIPAAGTAPFDQGFSVLLCNKGSGAASLMPATSTINGAASQSLPAYNANNPPACMVVIADGTNYDAYVIPLIDANGLVPLASGVSGNLPIGNVGSAGLSGTAPITISAAGGIACATCATTSSTVTYNGVSATVGGASANLGQLFDTAANPGLQLATVATPVNDWILSESATGTSPSVTCGGSGSDTNCGYTLNVKGTGAALLNGPSGSSMNMTGGTITLSGGNGSGVTIIANGAGGNVAIGGSTASSIPFKCKFGNASPTGDCFEGLTNGGAVIASIGPNGIVQSSGTQIVSGADYTNSTTTPSTVFSWTLPPTGSAKTYTYSCHGLWESTNTTLVGPVFGLNINAAPTQLTGLASVQNTLAGADVNGYLSNTTTGSQTLVTSSAAGVTSTNYWFMIEGTIEGAPTAGSTFIINAASTSGTTATLNIRRGSECTLQ